MLCSPPLFLTLVLFPFVENNADVLRDLRGIENESTAKTTVPLDVTHHLPTNFSGQQYTLKSGKTVKSKKAEKKSKKNKKSKNGSLTVMTRNIYLGADLNTIEDVSDSQGLVEFVASLISILSQDTDIHVRSKQLADEILQTKPDLIGIQEAATFIFTDPFGTENVIDYLTILLQELTKRNLNYSVAVKSDPGNPLGPFPSDFAGNTASFAMSDAILVNDDNNSIEIVHTASGIFSRQQTITTPFGDLEIPFGWCYVDGVTSDKKFRFANTHLNRYGGELNEAHAAEFLKMITKTDSPLIVVGDMNITPEGTSTDIPEVTKTYNILTEDLIDAWDSDGGYSCCFNERLTGGDLVERIDYILYDGKLKKKSVNEIGTTAFRDKKPLFASDHSGLVASFTL